VSGRVTLGGLDVLCGRIRLPLSGIWTGILELDADEAPSGVQELLVLGDGEPDVRLKCVTARRAAVDGRARCLLVGGRTGALSAEPELASVIPGQHYDGDPSKVTAYELIARICELAGEQLASSVKATLSALTVDSWHRETSRAGVALSRVLAAFGLSARVLPEGSLWAGVDTWPTVAEPEFVDPGDDGRVLYVAPRGARLAPGAMIAGRYVSTVEYLFGDALRARLHYSPA
jgi:hypothetical protein